MATLQTVQDSMAGAAVQKLDYSGSGTTLIDTNPDVIKYHIFRLVKKKQRRLRIDGICDGCVNPKTGKRERAYLIRGAASIWQSELGDLVRDIDKPNSYINKNRESILFEDGVCRIPSDDANALEYARVNKHNVGKNRKGSGKYDYYEYDAAEEQKFRLEKQNQRINMVIKAKEMPEDKMKKMAAFLGVSFIDELGMPKGTDGVRSELMIVADTRPVDFEKYIDSKEVEISWLVKRAILDAKIDLTAQSGNALWAGGQGFVAKIPSNRKAYEYLTELAMTNSEDGRQFLEKLKQVVT